MLQSFLIRHSAKFISHWVVLCVDFGITFALIPASYFIALNLRMELLDFTVVKSFTLLVLPAYLAGFLLFNSHKGIIRHTSLADAIRVLNGTVLGASIVLTINGLRDFDYLPAFSRFSYAAIVLHFLLVTLLLISFRFLVKLLYFRLVKGRLLYERVVIFGAGQLGMMTKDSLKRDHTKNYKIVAFLDDDPNKAGKVLEGVPVVSTEVIKSDFLEKYRIRSLIISIESLFPERRNFIVERCIKAGVGVRQTPAMQHWTKGKLHAENIRKIRIEDLLQRSPINLKSQHLQRELGGKTVLVTGAAGSIGSEIVRQLILNNVSKIVLVDQAETPLHDLLYELGPLQRPHTEVKPYVASILNEARMASIFRNEMPEIVYHAAAYKHVPMMEEHPQEAVLTNVFGTKIVSDLSVQYGAKKFVLVSTDKAVNPSSVMGMTKRIAEVYVQYQDRRQDDTRFVTTRFGNVLGSNGSVIPLFERQIREGGPVTITHPEVSRYFMTIPEACHLVLEAGVMGKGGELFVFDMGKDVKIVDLARKMITLCGYKPDLDIEIHYIGLRRGEKLHEELHYDSEEHLPTHHPQIMITRMPELALHQVEKILVELDYTLELESDKRLVEKLNELTRLTVDQPIAISEEKVAG